MDFLGGSAAGFRREMRAESAKDLRAGACGDRQSGFPTDSHRDSKADSRRDSQRDLQGEFRGDFDGVLLAEPDGTTGERIRNPDIAEFRKQIPECKSADGLPRGQTDAD
jgi:hypothetical protein